MPKATKVRRALISVYDKTGIVDFARALHEEFAVEIISTGGTAKTLTDAGIPVRLVEDITGSPELLGGRVKTLHPKIFAAILANRNNPEHMRQLEEQGIEPIDMVVVNLYPFEETVADPNCTFEEALEMIDIGGPSLLRAAAKNHKHVLVLHDPWDWNNVLGWLREDLLAEQGWQSVRRDYAVSTFRLVSAYNAAITDYLIRHDTEEAGSFHALLLTAWDRPRYGENPHQSAQVLRPGPPCQTAALHLFSVDPKTCEAAVELSFNNYADASAALELCAELARARGLKMHAPSADARSTERRASELWHRLIAGAEPAPAGSKQESQYRAIDDEVFTRRNLPHIQRPGATYFVTFRAKRGTLSPAERDLVMECCLFLDGKKLSLHETVVMPDHVHLLFTPLESGPGQAFSLTEILHSIKGVSGRKVADDRGRRGPVWQDESFDHVIRNADDFYETLAYIYTNPSRAKLETGGPYPWLVFEEGAEWDTGGHGAIIDPQHILEITGREARPWHRLLANATTAKDANRESAALKGKTPTSDKTTGHTCCFIKHTNACGVGIADDPIEAYRRAYLGDPKAAMGGILALNFNVDAAFAEAVMESLQRWGKDAGAGAFFVEVWVAPSFDEAAVKLIRTKKKWGERVRLLDVGEITTPTDPNELEFKSIAGGMLAQTRDLVGLNEDQWKVVTERQPTDQEMADLRLAWLIAKHTKSNAISICKDGMLIGSGAGQMSRVMSCRIATWLAKDNRHEEKLHGAVAASDGFFPFRDGPDLLADAGVSAIIQPGGSKRDQKVIDACNERGVAMIFTDTRHFRH